MHVSDDVDRHEHRVDNDDFSQPSALFRLMLLDQKRQLFDNIAAAMKGMPEAILLRQNRHFNKADSAYEQGVAKGLGLVPKLKAAE